MSLWTDGNAFELLENGDAFFNAVLKSIDEAKVEVFFETYIYEWDSIGQRLGTAFTQAAERGIKVHVLLDGFGSHHLPMDVMENWHRFGIQARYYRPLKNVWLWRKNSFPRLHRKCIVIDQSIAFVGGINVADDYLQQPNQPPRLDYAIQIKGSLVLQIHKEMTRFFFRQFNEWKSYFSALKPSFNEPKLDKGNARAAFVIRSRVAHRRSIEKEYLKAISSAKKTILIANAYFLPGFWFRHQLKQARKRGVNIKLLLQGLPEFWLVRWATQSMYVEFLNDGIEIYEYRTTFLHAKVAVVDEQWSTVGSCNLDPFSLHFNLEANVMIEDSQFTKNLHEILETHIQRDSVKIELNSCQKQHVLTRCFQRFCMFFIRWFVSFSRVSDK